MPNHTVAVRLARQGQTCQTTVDINKWSSQTNVDPCNFPDASQHVGVIVISMVVMMVVIGVVIDGGGGGVVGDLREQVVRQESAKGQSVRVW